MPALSTMAKVISRVRMEVGHSASCQPYLHDMAATLARDLPARERRGVDKPLPRPVGSKEWDMAAWRRQCVIPTAACRGGRAVRDPPRKGAEEVTETGGGKYAFGRYLPSATISCCACVSAQAASRESEVAAGRRGLWPGPWGAGAGRPGRVPFAVRIPVLRRVVLLGRSNWRGAMWRRPW